MTKKSAAQIRRAQKRAEARGAIYVLVPPTSSSSSSSVEEEKNPAVALSAQSDPDDNKLRVKSKHESDEGTEKIQKLAKQDFKKRMEAAKKFTEEMSAIEKNTELKAKDRRTAKRRAEAIAAETSGCTVDELMEWYKQQDHKELAKPPKKENTKRRQNPYIAFIGQLSFETTPDDLFLHIESNLKNDKDFNATVTRESVKIRLLSDAKTKTSRGMAFVQVEDPETLYALLKLHRTFLKGRRINVERTTGGGTESRKTKLSSFRQEQEGYVKETVQSMLKEYQDRNAIREGEIDEGAIALCCRHSASVVQAALERYVESNGSEMDNPSAYLSFLLGKLSTEGIYETRDEKRKDMEKKSSNHSKARPPKRQRVSEKPS